MSDAVRLSNGVELRAIGERLRDERLRLGLSLDDVAGRSSVSRSMVSEIERGRKVPTIVVLDKITSALGTSLTRLFEPPAHKQVVVRRAAEQLVASDPAGWSRRILSPVLAGVGFEFMRTTIGAGVNAGEWMPHGEGSREYVAIESGRLVLTVDGVEYDLREGDSIFHDGNVHHSYRNPGRKDCIYYLVLDMGDVSGQGRPHR